MPNTAIRVKTPIKTFDKILIILFRMIININKRS
jgi:hypothetical protein